MVELRTILETLCARQDLTRDESRAVFEAIVAGALADVQVAGLLVALKAKGEVPAEIAGAAEALRAAAVPFPVDDDRPLVDTCGTGGDGAGTVNVSTAVALLGAELGLAVTKHGNRSISSRCGSADVLEAAGVRIDAPPEVARRCLAEHGFCFLFAPAYHAGMRNAMAARRGLGVRTIFNLLGPLANPAHPRVQLMGVYDPALCEPLAETLALLGCEAALVVHGDGLDEIALHAPTTAALLRHGRVRMLELDPTALGVGSWPRGALAGGDAAANAVWLRALLAGEGAPAHNAAVALNAGALLWLAGGADELVEGVARARAALLSGRAAERLAAVAETSHHGAR